MKNYTLKIGGNIINHTAVESISVTTKIIGAGVLKCKLKNNESLSYHEGDSINLDVDGVNLFTGRVMKKRRDKRQLITTTAYDQIFFLTKNRETYVYENKTAEAVIQMVAGDFGLSLGSIASTGYVIPYRVEDIQTLIDIIYTALDLTVINTGQLFVLHDVGGRLTLKNIRDMRLQKIISSEETLIDYDYETNTANNTYNKVKLVRNNEQTGRRDVFIEQDSGNMNRWGHMQQHQKVSDTLTEAQVINLTARKLQLLNRVQRRLKLDELYADPKIRAGNSLMVNIPDLGDIHLSHWLVVNRCTHQISNHKHTMQLDLTGDF